MMRPDDSGRPKRFTTSPACVSRITHRPNQLTNALSARTAATHPKNVRPDMVITLTSANPGCTGRSCREGLETGRKWPDVELDHHLNNDSLVIKYCLCQPSTGWD